ncbi:cadherin domain protein, partial [Ostertagia ostertagi]
AQTHEVKPQLAQTVVAIRIDDVNDCAPIFVGLPYDVVVSSDSAVGEKILAVKAVDKDIGVISVNGELDAEERAAYNLSVMARDVTRNALNSTAVVNVELTGVNDNGPRFEHLVYRVNVSESTPVDTKLLTVKAVDPDGGNGLISYAVSGKDSSIVHMDPATGILSLAQLLDFEKRQRYEMSLVAADDFTTGWRESSYILTNKTSILTVQGRDGVPPLHYSIGSGDNRQRPLRIEKLTGRVHPKIVFNYHHQHMYKVPLVVEDALGRKAFSTLTVNVVDANDSAPVFVVGNFCADVHHLCPATAREGETLLMVSATDDDVDDTVEYTLMGDDPMTQSFRLHPRHGTLSIVKPLDSLAGSTVNLVVRATDQANPPHHANAQVSISVLPEEVPIPKFSNSHYLFVIPEDSAVGTVIGKLQQTEGRKSLIFSEIPSIHQGISINYRLVAEVSEVRFSVVDAAKDFPFTVERATGQLVISRQLDRETKEVWRFVARADAAGSAHSMTTVTVRLSDVNDHAPMFVGAYDRLSISEDAPVGTTVAVFSATDADRSPGGTIAFTLVENEDDRAFKVDAESGWLTVASPLDRELQPLHELVILDVNDEAPQFDENFYIVHVDSSVLTIGQIIARVVVTDKDLPPFNHTRLFISRGNDDGLFAIDDSGKISIARLNQLRHSYNLTLLAFDGTHATTATMNVTLNSGTTSAFECDPEKKITIEYVFTRQLELKSVSTSCSQPVEVNVIDVNDEAPVFTKAGIHVSIKKMNQPAKMSDILSPGFMPLTRWVVMVIVFADFLKKDSGAYGRVQYSLVSDHGGIFVIDRDTGAITVTRPLDREQTHEYLLHVVAQDSDPVKPKSSKVPSFKESITAMVLVSVLDQNDNPPVFERNEYVLQVMESESVGYTLVTVRAEGGDAGETVSYRLAENGTHNDYVSLDKEKGNLFGSSPNPMILCPPLSSEAVVTIQVKAVDADSEHYGRVAYSIKDDASLFQIDDQGLITVAGQLDRETRPYHRFEVEARDGGEPAQKSVVTVLIDVNDVNDNSPVFADCNMTAVVQEGVMPGHTLLSLSISDADGPNFAGPFRVELIAHDRGNRSTDCPLTVFVKEESRHPPRIVPLRVSLNTLMGEFKGGVIGTVQANDERLQDAETLLRSRLVDGSVLGPLPTDAHPRAHVVKPHLFRVDAKTGEVWSAHGIHGGLHAFNVSVTDGKFTTVSYVEVEVTSLEQDAVDHAVAVRLKGMTALGVFRGTRSQVQSCLRTASECGCEKNIQLLSVQETSRTRQPRSLLPDSKNTDLDILFTVSRGGGRGMLKPDHVYTRLKHDFQSIVDQSGTMKYQLTTEMCTPGVCQRGECRERVYLDDQQQTMISTGGVAFVAPNHHRVAECICPEGYGGSRCEQEVNACARSPCHPWEMCVPSEGSRFECVCPPGSSGDRCSQASCANEGRCLEGTVLLIDRNKSDETSQFAEAELSVGGTGYFEMSIAHEMETRMELEVELKTTTLTGVILHAHGPSDFHMLELVDGRVVYRWDAGSGEGSVATEASIADAQWHRISVSRRGRRTRLQLDGVDTKEGWSPAGSDVINLYSSSHRLFFGARVERENSSSVSITKAIVACFRAISIDRRSVAKTRQGLRLYSASTGCRAMAATPCSEAPCRNGGICQVIDRTYQCTCPARYTGANCEIDTDPCGSRPCPLGIQCIPFYNEYLCKCPNGFTGKRCEIRGYAYYWLLARLIGEDAKVWRRSVACLWPCDASSMSVPATSGGPAPTLCTKERSRGSGFRDDIRILEQAQLTVSNQRVQFFKVRPLPQRERLSSSGRGDSRSPSLVGTGKQWKRATDYGSAADDLDESGRVSSHDSGAMEALRRFGFRVTEEDEPGRSSSGKNRARVNDRHPVVATRDALSALNQERIESLTGRVKVGETVLSPVINDDDYMTMRPRRNLATSGESQRRPLLDQEDDSDGTDDAVLSSQAPPPPSHKNVFNSRIYDDPPTRGGGGGDTDSLATSAAICDIDASDVEELSTDAIL